MYRLILIVSLLPIVTMMIARWWFGRRVLASLGKRGCRSDLARWQPPRDGKSAVSRADGNAAEFGRELRLMALRAWHEEEPKAAKSREGVRRFGTAVPPLATMVAAFALLVGRLPVLGVFAVLFAATALACAMAMLGLPTELRAIARHARRVRSEKPFPDSEDEQAVIDCAIAHAWNDAAPPILRWIQG